MRGILIHFKLIYLLSNILLSLFVASGLHKEQRNGIGMATIEGKIRAYKDFPFKTDNDQVSVTSYDPVPKTYLATVKKNGTFKLTFPKGFTGDVQFNFIDNNPIQVLVGPGDHQYYLIEPTVIATVIKFSGSNARVNREMRLFIKARSANWPKTLNNSARLNMYYHKSLNTIKLTHEDILALETKFLDEYISSHNVSDLFKQWARADAKYEYAYRWCKMRVNQHNPVSDPDFFLQYPVNESANLISSNYLRYISPLPLSFLHKMPNFHSTIVFPKDKTDERTRYRASLDSARQLIYDDMIKYADWTDPEFTADMASIERSPHALLKYMEEKPDALAKYLIPKDARFYMNYITNHTSGLVRDVLFAGYILPSLKSKSGSGQIDGHSRKLLNAYVKAVPEGTYLEMIKGYVIDK